MPCPLCSSDDMKSNRVVALCRSCHSAFSLGEVPKRHYEDHYQLTRSSTAAAEHRRLFRLPEQLKLIRTIASYRPAPGRLLDIGCDKGYSLTRRGELDIQRRVSNCQCPQPPIAAKSV